MSAVVPRVPAAWPLVLLAGATVPTAGAAPGLPPVTTGAARLTPIVQEVTVTGSVVSPRASRVSTEIAGRVARMLVEAGDPVAQGDTLLTLDEELSAIEMQVANASVDEARASLADARRRYTEAERLIVEKTIPETEYRARQAEVDIAAAVLARRRAEASRQSAVLARHALKAPYTGVVSERLVNVGEWVEPGTPVLEMVDTASLRVDFQVPQELFPRIDEAVGIEVQFDALPERAFRARLAAKVPRSDGSARTFLLLTTLADDGAPIIPGMSAEARLRLDTGREGVTVPRDGILRHPDGRVTVWVVQRDGDVASVSERRIEVGRAFAGRVEVVDGLRPGTEIILRGNEALEEGQRVAVQTPG